MFTGAVIAMMLGVIVAVLREIERQFPSTPARWAWEKAKRFQARNYQFDKIRYPEIAGAIGRLGVRYRELALAFERTGESWGEGTYLGPFTDKLAPNQCVVMKDGAWAEPSDLEGKRGGRGASWMVAPGTIATVVADWALDEDACGEFRGILIRFAAGPHRGEIGLVQRVYMRRRRTGS